MSTTGPEATERGAGGRKVLSAMLERLFASIASGPSLNCRPHNSRQRIDWLNLAKLGHTTPEAALRSLLGDDAEVKLRAMVPPPPSRAEDAPPPTDAERAAFEGAKKS